MVSLMSCVQVGGFVPVVDYTTAGDLFEERSSSATLLVGGPTRAAQNALSDT